MLWKFKLNLLFLQGFLAQVFWSCYCICDCQMQIVTKTIQAWPALVPRRRYTVFALLPAVMFSSLFQSCCHTSTANPGKLFLARKYCLEHQSTEIPIFGSYLCMTTCLSKVTITIFFYIFMLNTHHALQYYNNPAYFGCVCG